MDLNPAMYKTQKATISHLRKLSKKCSDVYLACDKDREGESIAWHIAEVPAILHLKEKEWFLQKLQKRQFRML